MANYSRLQRQPDFNSYEQHRDNMQSNVSNGGDSIPYKNNVTTEYTSVGSSPGEDGYFNGTGRTNSQRKGIT